MARTRIDAWLDPFIGGDGSGWPFGAAVRWHELVRMLLDTVPGLDAISRVTFVVDGRQLSGCVDVVLAPGELVWPATHLLEAVHAAPCRRCAMTGPGPTFRLLDARVGWDPRPATVWSGVTLDGGALQLARLRR